MRDHCRVELPYVLRYNMSNYGRRAFSYAWNLLAEHVRKSISVAILKRSSIRVDYAFSAF